MRFRVWGTSKRNCRTCCIKIISLADMFHNTVNCSLLFAKQSHWPCRGFSFSFKENITEGQQSVVQTNNVFKKNDFPVDKNITAFWLGMDWLLVLNEKFHNFMSLFPPPPFPSQGLILNYHYSCSMEGILFNNYGCDNILSPHHPLTLITRKWLGKFWPLIYEKWFL